MTVKYELKGLNFNNTKIIYTILNYFLTQVGIVIN